MNEEPQQEQATFKRSGSIAALAAALAKAQGCIGIAAKTSANPFFKSKYADLASVWEAIRAPLSSNGLAIIQFPRSTRDGVEVETVLTHESGEYVAETLSLPVAKHDAQGVGSAITYARRYGLQSIAGVAPDDDDGNAAARSNHHSIQANSLSPAEQEAAKAAHPQPSTDPSIDQGQADQLETIAAELRISPHGKLAVITSLVPKGRLSGLKVNQIDKYILRLHRQAVGELLTELKFNLDDVRNENPAVVADTPAELDLDQANAALKVLLACKARLVPA